MKLAGFIKVGFCVFSLNSLVIQVSQEPQISKSYRQRIIKYAKLFHKTSQMRRVACKFFVNLFTKENAGTIVENIVLNAANKKKFMLAVTLIERLIFSGRQSQANVLFNHIFDTDNRDACFVGDIILYRPFGRGEVVYCQGEYRQEFFMAEFAPGHGCHNGGGYSPDRSKGDVYWNISPRDNNILLIVKKSSGKDNSHG